MLCASLTLSSAHFYKEEFLKTLDCEDRDSAKTALSEWITSAFDCGIERFQKCTQTMINWQPISLIHSRHLSLTALRKVATIRSKSLKESLTVTEIFENSGIVSFISFLTNYLITRNKRQLLSHRLSILSFCFFRVYPNY